MPPPPQFDAGPNGGLRGDRVGENGSIPSAADHNVQRDGLQLRGKTVRELTIGRKLRELREQRHLTQQQMAGKAGVPRTYISRIENARLLPGPIMLHRIADALAVPILDLLPRNGNDNGFSGSEEDFLWTSMVGHFSRLRPQQMAQVLAHVRTMVGERKAGETKGQSFAPQLVAR